MKFFIIRMGLFLFTLQFIACNEFLDVTPRTQTPMDNLLDNEAGFKDALSGAYIQMKGASAYGSALSYGTIEYLTSSWDVTANTTQQRLGLFNYTDEGVENTLSGIYGQLYKVIASCNAILGQIDEKRSVFRTEGLYETIKGECLAIRAYCHFDVLRLFGPIPTDPSIGSQLAYMTQLSSSPNELISYASYRQALMTDLEEAAALMENTDPITQYSLAELRSPGPTATFNPSDTYLAYRYLRLNYYAVKALQARAYLWFGDEERAYQNAKLLIEASNSDGSGKFRLGSAADMTAGNYVLTTEHIFGLYAFDMYQTFASDFGSGEIRKGTAATTIRNQLYGNTGTDIRETYLWNLITLDNQAVRYIIRKYNVVENPANLGVDYKQIPMLRLSELYLIAAETAPLAEAQTFWDAFRTARNLQPAVLPVDPGQRTLEILKEYRREFYAEGQGFFAYKRINAEKSAFLFAPAAATVNYLIPLPRTETVNLN